MAYDQTLVLSEDDIVDLMDWQTAVRLAEEVLSEQGRGNVEMPPKQMLKLRSRGLDSYCNSMPAYLEYNNVMGIKWGGGFGANQGSEELPFMVQTIILADPRTGYPYAILGASYITSLKTGTETAVAGKYLARQDGPLTGAWFGIGDQGRANVHAWLALHELGDIELEEIRLVDINPEASRDFADELSDVDDVAIRCIDDAESAVRGADVVVTATHAEEPIVEKEWLDPGVFVGSLGSFPEIDPRAVLDADSRYVDNWMQNVHRGEFKELIAADELLRDDVTAELPAVVGGVAPGRESDDASIVASIIGLGSIDLGIAREIYERARERGVGQSVTMY